MAIAKLIGGFAIYAVWVLIALGFSMLFTTGGNPNGDISPWFVVIYLILIMAPLGLYRIWQKRTPAWIKKVQDEGKQARATVIEVGSTGITIGRTRSVILVKIRVEPTDDAPFELIQQKTVSLFGGYSEGEHLQVKYDPNNKKHVVMVESTASSYRDSYISASVAPGSNNGSHHKTSGVVLTDKLAELSSLHKSGELSDSEFDAAKKKLLD